MIFDDAAIDTLRSDSIQLFQLEQADVSEAYLGWLSNRHVTQYLEVRFAAQKREDVLHFVEQCRLSPTNLLLGIRERSGNEHVGNIKVAWSASHLVGDLGIMLGEPRHWRSGYGSQAVQLVTDFAFRTLRLRKLIAGIYRSNVGSVRTFTKAGYGEEAVLRQHVLLDGRPEDVLLYSTLAGARFATPAQ